MIVAALTVTQDFQIFPGGTSGKLRGYFDPPRLPPSGVESFFVTTPDGERLNVWYQPAKSVSGAPKNVAVITHGNGGDLLAFYVFQDWFRSLGIPSYSFDYRGFGLSSGWPSEKGIYTDTDTVITAVRAREKVGPNELVLLGYSLGGAPAARAAAALHVKALMLLAPFSRLTALVHENPLFGYLAPLVWYSLPTADFVSQLRETCLILAHGEQDLTIPSSHSTTIQQAYQGSGGVQLILSPTAHHDNILGSTQQQLSPALKECLRSKT
jgi:pimeloyl-ACP methyl ester carboxylesterase